MKQKKAMSGEHLPGNAAAGPCIFRAPATITLMASDIEAAIPHGHVLQPFAPGQTVTFPAAEIFSGNVPKISLHDLSLLLPGHIAPSDAVIVLPAGRLAAAYNGGGQPAPSGDGGTGEPAETVPAEIAPPRKHEGSFSGALEITGQRPLQSLLLTEDTLTVDRVIELCANLPGIGSCVLMLGTTPVTSHLAQENPAPLSCHAGELLGAIRESSARIGLGPVTGATLRTENGSLSVFQRDDLALLVCHNSRSIIPGVHEKIEAALEALARERGRKL